MSDNPILDTGDAIWTMLESKAEFVSLFPTNTPHQVRMNTLLSYGPDPDMEELAPADYPRCRVVVQSLEPQLESDSTASLLSVRYGVEVCTGQQYQNVAMTTWWAIFQSMTDWRAHLSDVVQWNNAACIHDATLEPAQFFDRDNERSRGFQQRDRTRGTQQWIGVGTIVVKMDFRTTHLRNA
jgi:hypothetical protein